MVCGVSVARFIGLVAGEWIERDRESWDRIEKGGGWDGRRGERESLLLARPPTHPPTRWHLLTCILRVVIIQFPSIDARGAVAETPIEKLALVSSDFALGSDTFCECGGKK